MRRPKVTAQRWLAQAEHSLQMAQMLFSNQFWAGACFQAEQTSQMALKSFLFLRGARSLNIHSVRDLAESCAEADEDFSAFADYGRFLDRFYLTTRYPDALPEPAVPYESFGEQEADEAVRYAAEMVQLAHAKISEFGPGPNC